MENLNLGAIVFALFVGVWVIYAIPKIAERRMVLGEAEKISAQRHSTTARDLTEACRSVTPRTREEIHMRDTKSLLRPADPTTRPRFETREERAEIGAAVIAGSRRQNSTALAVILGVLALATLALVLTTAFELTPLWAPIASFGVLAVYTAILRFTHVRSVAKSLLVSETVAETEEVVANEESEVGESGAGESALVPAAELAESSRELTFAERHEMYLREVMAKRADALAQPTASASSQTFRYGAISSRDALESATLEETEARLEGGSYVAEEKTIFASGLTLDEVLERRRA